MSPEEILSPQEPLAHAAPPRAVRLTAKKPLTEEERLAARKARRAQTEAPKAPPQTRAFLEKKLAGLHDAQDILRVMDTELALRRSARSVGEDGKSRQAMRVLSVTVLFALLIAALAAMGWLQSHLAQTGFSRHRPEIRSQK